MGGKLVLTRSRLEASLDPWPWRTGKNDDDAPVNELAPDSHQPIKVVIRSSRDSRDKASFVLPDTELYSYLKDSPGLFPESNWVYLVVLPRKQPDIGLPALADGSKIVFEGSEHPTSGAVKLIPKLSRDLELWGCYIAIAIRLYYSSLVSVSVMTPFFRSFLGALNHYYHITRLKFKLLHGVIPTEKNNPGYTYSPWAGDISSYVPSPCPLCSGRIIRTESFDPALISVFCSSCYAVYVLTNGYSYFLNTPYPHSGVWGFAPEYILPILPDSGMPPVSFELFGKPERELRLYNYVTDSYSQPSPPEVSGGRYRICIDDLITGISTST